MPSPPVVLTKLDIGRGSVHVVRDDLLEGGTKQRAAIPFLEEMHEQGFREFVYASPFSGYAQVALAVSCEKLGLACTLFCERDPSAPTPLPHAFSSLSAAHGATIHLCENLAEAETASVAHSEIRPSALKIPLGFHHPRYLSFLREKLLEQWERIAHSLGPSVTQLWVPVGSGTLAKVFLQVLPPQVSLRCVDVRVLSPGDERLSALRAVSGLRYFTSAETFPEPARKPPPIASNLFYDAKLWTFLLEHAAPDDVWWNVAG